MRTTKHKYRSRFKKIAKLKMLFAADPFINESDLYVLVQNPSDVFVPMQFHEEVLQLIVISPGTGRLIWTYPPHIIDEYDFCPDRRLQTHRLFGKPALGPSPPDFKQIVWNNAGFVYNWLNLN